MEPYCRLTAMISIGPSWLCLLLIQLTMVCGSDSPAYISNHDPAASILRHFLTDYNGLLYLLSCNFAEYPSSKSARDHLRDKSR